MTDHLRLTEVHHTPEEQLRIKLDRAAEPLWSALEGLGWVDAHGGAEFQRVFPQMLDLIRREANLGPGDSSVRQHPEPDDPRWDEEFHVYYGDPENAEPELLLRWASEGLHIIADDLLNAAHTRIRPTVPGAEDEDGRPVDFADEIEFHTDQAKSAFDALAKAKELAGEGAEK